MPYYPEWKIHEKYKGKLWFTETLNGVRVHRCPLYVPEKVSSKKRILHEFSFSASSFLVWVKILFSKKFDVVFCVAPPFHLGFLPLMYQFLRGAKTVYHVQDLQVDAARNLGMLRNKSFLKCMAGMENWLMKKSTKVSTISEGMINKIKAKGIPSDKILFFPNWIDAEMIHPLTKENSLRKELNIDPKTKVVLYSGNLGEKQGLEIIIETAKDFSEEKNVLFLICGSGGEKEKLMKSAQDAGLSNIRFLPLQPYEKLSALLATADVHLVLQKKSASDLVMPSKLAGILAAGGCAVITALPGTSLYEIIDKNKCGILVEPESSEALKNGIEFAFHSDMQIFQQNARRYAERYLEKHFILKNFEIALRDI
jgi:colanic acid biosynthesis glycosyl transferase WcaI